MKTIIELTPKTFVSAAHIAYIEPVDGSNCVVHLTSGKFFQVAESAAEVARTINNANQEPTNIDVTTLLDAVQAIRERRQESQT